MAKNYTAKEAIEVIVKNEDAAAVLDVTRRFSSLALLAARIRGNEVAEEVAAGLPDFLMARKFDKTLRGDVSVGSVADEDEEEDDSEEEAPAKAKKAEKPAKKAAKKAKDEEEEDDEEEEEKPVKKSKKAAKKSKKDDDDDDFDFDD